MSSVSEIGVERKLAAPSQVCQCIFNLEKAVRRVDPLNRTYPLITFHSVILSYLSFTTRGLDSSQGVIGRDVNTGQGVPLDVTDHSGRSEGGLSVQFRAMLHINLDSLACTTRSEHQHPYTAMALVVDSP